MRERPEQILKFVCWALAALLLFQFVRIVFEANPLAHVVIPALPSLPEDTSAAGPETNASPSILSPDHGSRNLKQAEKTNSPLMATNAIQLDATTLKGTNSNLHPRLARTESNAVAASVSTGTNRRSVHPGGRPAVLLAHSLRRLPGRKPLALSPAIQARVNRVTDSEILGPVIRPLPMALLGIAGDDAFLRAPDGQSGLVKEGGELGGVKLLRIGVNRVLVEQDGQKKELTIFAGLGGQSLLDKPPEPSHETNTH